MTKARNQTALALMMWSLGALFYFYEFILNVSPGVMMHDMMRSFDGSARMVSTMASIYLWVYGLMQIPVGVLLDRYGPRWLLSFAALNCAVGAFIFSIATGMTGAYTGRALLGFGAAFAIVGCMKIIANWFPPNRFAFLLGCVLFIGMFGAVFGEAPLALLVHLTTWRVSLQILAVIGIIIAILVFSILRDSPEAHAKITNTSCHLADEHPLTSIRHVLFDNGQTWLASIYGALMFAPTLAFGGLWGVPFLQQAYGINATTAGGVISWIFIGWAIGSPLAGWISDTVGRRKTTMYLGSFGALITMSAIIYVPQLNLLSLSIGMFLLGLFSSGFLMAFPLVKEINPHKYNATALGFINTLNTFGGALLQPVIGIALDYFWLGEMRQGLPYYTTQSYQFALSCLPFAILVSILFLPFIRETYCRHIDGEAILG